MKISRYWIPCLFAMGIYAILVAVEVSIGIHRNQGFFVYPLDDAYIHLAMARSFALHGVWGITPHEFSGASSSPGWTLLLAFAVKIFGVHLAIPLLLNIAFGLLLLIFVTYTFFRWTPRTSMGWVFASLLAMTLLIPLPGLTLIGMETVLQALCITVLGVIGVELLSPPVPDDQRRSLYAPWLIVAFAAAAVRYETVFFVVAYGAIASLQRKFKPAILLAVSTALPPALYALYSVHKGGYALPYSVIVKSHQAHTGHFSIVTSVSNLIGSPLTPIFLIALIVLTLRLRIRALTDKTQMLLLLFLGTCFLHILVGPIGWLMRYEGYLFAFGVAAVGLALGEGLTGRPPGRPLIGRRALRQISVSHAALFIALIPVFHDLIARAHQGYVLPLESAHDRFVEHLSPALFVAGFYRDGTVVANDIGFLSYYGHATVLDPIGLGSIEPVRLLRSGTQLTDQTMADWAASAHADIAILQTDYPNIHDIVPNGWTLVETWCYPRNVVFHDHTISFFAMTPQKAEKLRTDLRAFAPVSPEVVRTEYANGSDRAIERPLSEIAPCRLSRGPVSGARVVSMRLEQKP